MEQADFEKTWGELSRERHALIEQRTNLENDLVELRKKISHLDEVLTHLAPLAGQLYDDTNFTSISHLGLTDAIRRVFNDVPDERLSAQDVRRILEEREYDLSGLSAPMASIYKILSRLEESGKIKKEKDGVKTLYKYQITDEDIPF